MIRILSCLALSAISVWAELLPTWSPHQMCAEAAAIVTGERVGANRVAVREWILSPSDGRKVRSVINIATIIHVSRTYSFLCFPITTIWFAITIWIC